MNGPAPELLPHSLDAEEAVLGALLLDNECIPRVAAKLAPDDFYAAANGEVYTHTTALAAAGKPVDVITLSESLASVQKLDYIGGIAYLGSLVENVPTAANVDHYAGIVADHAQRRRVVVMFNQMRQAAMSPIGEPVADLLSAARDQLATLEADAKATGWHFPTPISAAEFAGAQLSPRCIVEDMLFADVGVVVAPGATGKTTLLLYEAAHIVLGLPLYGLRVFHPGAVLLITAEDSREICVARLRQICDALQLSDQQRATVMRDVRISDVRGLGFKLTRINDDTIVPAPAVNRIIAECKGRNVVLINIDPTVSFGVGESRVNDAEQALVDAARRLVRELDCCVRYVHHSGKSNSREKTTDQYTSRGGSALPDGCRMVTVLQPLDADEWKTATGMSLLDGESAMVLARPKLSYAPPQPDLLLCRKGYGYSHTTRAPSDPMQALAADADQILRLVESELSKGRRPTKHYIEGLGDQIGLPRKRIRSALATLEACNRVEEVRIEPPPKAGARSYLRPVHASPNANGEPSPPKQ